MSNDNLPPLCGTLKRTYPSLTEESHERFVRAYGQTCYEAGQRDAVTVGSASVPDGYMMVPIKPTPEMVEAGCNADPERESVWTAYLAAAPTPDRTMKAKSPVSAPAEAVMADDIDSLMAYTLKGMSREYVAKADVKALFHRRDAIIAKSKGRP